MKKLFFVVVYAFFALSLIAPSYAAQFSPTGTTTDNPKFKVEFPAPMVEISEVGKLVAPKDFPFKTEPAIIADGVWESPTVFTAALVSPLPKATAFTATLLKSGEIFKFQTEPLKLISAVQAYYSNARGTPEVSLKLEFNLPVSPNRLNGFLSLTTAANKKISVAQQGAMPSKTVYFSAKLDVKDDKVILNIAKGLLGEVGSLGLQEDIKQTIDINQILNVTDMVMDGEESRISITVNQEISAQNIAKFIELYPALPFRVEASWRNNTFFIIAEFKPRQRIGITLKKGLPSKDGRARLASDAVMAFIFPDAPPKIELPAAGMYLSPLVGTNVPIETVNVREIEISLWRLYESNIPYVLRNSDYWEDFPLDLSSRVAKKLARIDSTLNEKTRRSIDLKTLISGDRKNGLYLLSVKRPDSERWEQQTQIISLSDIGLTAHVWPGGCLVWANSISTSKPVANALIKIYDAASQLIAEGRTDSQGLCRYFPDDLKSTPRLITANVNGDVSFVQLQNSLINSDTFDTGGREWSVKYDGIIFTPRGIYRPGEDVAAKAIVREPGNKVPSPFPVLFVVRDSMGRTMKRGTAMLSAQGGADVEYSISDAASSGEYSISMYVPGAEEEPFAISKFSVESFAPPRIEVKIAREDAEGLFVSKGENLAISVSSQYLFGVPAANMPYEITYRTSAADFKPENDKFRGFNFSDPEKAENFRPESGMVGEGNLDEKGNASKSVESDEDWNPPSIIDLTVIARVQEDSGRWIANQTTYKYFPNPYILGVQAPESVPIGKSAEFAAAALAMDGNVIEEVEEYEVKATLYKVSYHYSIVQIDGVSRWQMSEEFNKIEEKEVLIENGMAKFTFDTVKNWGEYLVKVEAEDDEKISASARFWGDSPGMPGARLMDKVELEFDKPSYKINEVAKVRVKSPFAGTLLLTVENSKLVGQQVIEMPGNEVEVSIPLSDDMALGSGNLWCSASVIRPVKLGEPWMNHRALGVKPLILDRSDSKLTLTVEAPEKILPKTTLSVKIKAPAGSEVALALVDEGVLQITGYGTPDPFGYFYAKRAMSSSLFDIYDLLMQAEPVTTEALHPAGGASAKAAAFMGKVDARRFKILSLFKPSIITDANGEANVELDIIEFSGRARLFAVAFSGSSFASAERFVQIGRDIIVEPNLPRFAAIGDTFASPLSVFNLSETQQKIKLSLKTEGGLEIVGPREIDVSVPSKGSNRYEVGFKALMTGSAKYTANEQEIELPIRGIYPTVTQIGTGSFSASAGEAKINAPRNAVLTITGTPLADISPALNYLMGYPYRCLEQTVSRAWGALEGRPATMGAALTEALAGIQAKQLYDGSFAFWAGDNTTYKWGSVYAAHFLSELRRANLSENVVFPEETFKGVMNYLRALLADSPDGEDGKIRADMTTMAYACFVLALEKEAPLGWMYWLNENAQNLLPSGRIWLAGAYALSEGKSDALKKLGDAAELVNNAETLESAVRNTAQQLLLWSMVEPSSSEALNLARKLSEWGKASRWYGTQENALALLALSRYANAVKGEKTDLKCVISDAGGKEIKTFSLSDGREVLNLAGVSLPLKIKAEGTGTGYFTWELTGEPEKAPAPEERGLRIESVWTDRDGKNLPKDIPLGTEVFVSLRIIPTTPANNIVVSVLLPAGFEFESTPVKTQQDTQGFRKDARDDRLLLFFNSLYNSVEYKYTMRAVTRGKFAVPPITAEGMYSPAYRFIGKGSTLNIVKK